MAEALVTTFSNVYDNTPPPATVPHQHCDSTLSRCIPQTERVRLHLSKLKNGSSPGPDGVSSTFLKRFAAELAPPLTQIFSQSLDSSIVPEQFKTARVSAIYKGKGSRSDPSNYRPISLTSIPGKLLEKTVYECLMNYFTENSILIDNQFGFRSKRSTVDQLLHTYETITKWYDEGEVVDVVLFDYSKAFDRPNHNLMIDKHKCLGIEDPFLGWLLSFLVDRVMFVSVGGSSSSYKGVSSGVPQGSVLGPLLFLIFVNHLTHNLHCKHAFFADDLKIFLTTSSGDNVAALQEDINNLARISADWGLQFNVDKSVNLRFQRSLTPNTDSIFTLNGSPITCEPFHKDLGVIIDSSLRFHNQAISAASKAGGVALNLFKGTTCRSRNFMMTLLISHIRPILEYGSQVWNTGYSGDLILLESVQRRWTKRIDGSQDLTYENRLRELDLFSVKGRLWRSDMIYCWKILHGFTPLSPEHFFTKAPNVGTRGHPYKLFVPQASIEARKRFFSHRVVSDWNSLPSLIVESTTVNQFKGRLASLCRDKLFDFIE